MLSIWMLKFFQYIQVSKNVYVYYTWKEGWIMSGAYF